ncbi:peptide/nickel transport system ATP-binding protein [Caldicoprobacter guelmensis]|uniref:ABC transporter ATP-binding protein n=1 Tax=Caldicoprobacter guelmensis TaxID=1170224 RepID=UPI00195877C3|nr:ABC transporter ATP-binding protein [Caldicoprobacter guelmensis]MBM7582483.1 peptide/nickel transport system ATP-binding protein [Caldicoprobacter guelmensis]
MGDNVLLEVKNLRTYFFLDEGVVKAVDGVNFKIEKGKTFGVVGESGCGKSITAQSILRILPPRGEIVEGEITLYREDGSVDLVKLNPKGQEIRDIRGKEIAMVFQEPMTALAPVYTIGDQIIEAILLHQNVTKEQARKIAIDLLGRVGIPKPEERVDAYPFELSGGMRQRAMIAMAISSNPSLLIADEPTTALDVTIQAQILDLIKNLQKEMGMATMLITHNMGVIAEMADDVAVMYLGKIVESGPLNEIFYNPKHPYTVALLKSIPKVGEKVKGRLESIEGMVPDPYNLPTGCRFHPRCPSYMKGKCDKVEPPEIEITPGHKVSCFLYGGR